MNVNETLAFLAFIRKSCYSAMNVIKYKRGECECLIEVGVK